MTHLPPTITGTNVSGLGLPARPEPVARAVRAPTRSTVAIELDAAGLEDGELVLRERATGEERRAWLHDAGGGRVEAIADLGAPSLEGAIGTWAAYVLTGPDAPWRRLVAGLGAEAEPVVVRHGLAGVEVAPRTTLDGGLVVNCTGPQAGFAAGADHYLTKPFSPLQLLSIIAPGGPSPG